MPISDPYYVSSSHNRLRVVSPLGAIIGDFNRPGQAERVARLLTLDAEYDGIEAEVRRLEANLAVAKLALGHLRESFNDTYRRESEARAEVERLRLRLEEQATETEGQQERYYVGDGQFDNKVYERGRAPYAETYLATDADRIARLLNLDAKYEGGTEAEIERLAALVPPKPDTGDKPR